MKKLFTILFCLLGVIANADDVVMALLQPRVADGSDPCRPIEMNMVRGELRKAFGWQSEFQVVTRTDLDQIVKEIGFQQSGMVTENQRKTIGEMTGAQYICVSTITKEGTQLYIESYLVDVETGQMTNPATQYANIPNNDYSTLKEPCNELAREMLGELDGGKRNRATSFVSKSQVSNNSYSNRNSSSSTLSISKTSISAPSDGLVETITVSSNTAWDVQFPTGAMYAVTRNGNELTVRIHENTSSESRNDCFFVKTSDGSHNQRIKLSQSGRSGAPSLSVNKTTVSALANGKTESIYVTCNTQWEVQHPTGSMYSVSRNGNTLTVTINENTSPDSRADYFNVKTTDGSKSIKISLTQSGNYSGSTSNTSAKVNRVWVDQNVYQDGEKGMKIHIDMNASNLKSKKCRAIAYFYSDTETPLKDTNESYCTTNGNVSCGESFTPRYDNSHYEDFTLFMPYRELHIRYKGTYRFYVNLWDYSVTPHKDLAESDWILFTYNP